MAMSSEENIKEEEENIDDVNDNSNNDVISTVTTLQRQRSLRSPGFEIRIFVYV